MNQLFISFNNSSFQNLVNNMKNEIGRKITSLTLMTIMLAGGMTIAFPGFTPDAYAVNANLIVSAENTGGYVDGAQVVEIVVIDDDLDAAAFPDVTVNGDAVAMTRTNDGNWYAYIADTAAAGEVDDTDDTVSGIDFGALNTCAADEQAAGSSDSDFVYCSTDSQNVPDAAKGPLSTDVNDNWPFIQTYAFPSTIEIQYNKAGGTQIATLSFDSSADGLSLDRSNYPAGATVHVTIIDHRLNIDPTSDDVWTWNILNDDKYYGDATSDIADNGDVIGQSANSERQTNAVCADCSVQVNYNRISSDPVIEINAVDDLDLPDATAAAVDDPDTQNVDETAAATAWFTVAEDGGPNTGIFTATNLSDESILTVVDGAARGSSGSITYDGTEKAIDVKYNEATIAIESPDDVWTSGLAIPIVVVDGDVNKNSLADDDLAVSDPNSIIPTLVTGDPFTLGEVSNNLVTWVGWSVGDSGTADGEFNRLLATASDTFDTAASLNYTVNGDNPFTLKGFPLEKTGDPLVYADETDDTAPNAVVLQQAAEVELFSDRAILEFGVDFDTPAMNSLNLLAGVAQFEGDDTDQMNNGYFMEADFLVIDFDNNLGALQDSLIDDSSAVGHNFLNYDVRSLGVSPTSLEILLDGTTVGKAIDLGEQKDYININATALLASDLDATSPLQFKLNFNNDLAVKSGEKYPIAIDFFSFGYENDGEASDERIANQIIRLELEESDSDTGSLEGTLEYIMINQLNIDDQATYAGLATIDDEVSFIVIEDLTGSSAPSVTYLDVDTNGIKTQVSAQEDAPSHSGVVSLNVDSFKAADLVTVTLEDLDLNVNSGLPDVYTVVTEDDDNRDTVGKANSPIGRMLEITFDDERWITPLSKFTDPAERENDPVYQCLKALEANGDKTGLGNTGFTLSESGDATGIFVGTFSIPAKFCSGGTSLESVTGLDIEVNYVDFRDASGETTEVGASAGVKANTGSVSLDRTVYPVPFGTPGDFLTNDSSTPAQGNSETRSLFPIHQSGMNGDGIAVAANPAGLTAGEFLPQGDLIVYVTVTDPDFDVSASGKDSIAIGDAPVTISVIRGSASVTVAEIGDASNPIDEIAPDAGIFESSVTIDYYEGPKSTSCPSRSVADNVPNPDYAPHNDNENGHNCILQGDILQVEYRDPTDASGEPNTVTDSATFDLRNGVLQSDKSVYIIGSDMILTLIEPDLDLDSSQNETYDLDLIKWSSSAATVTMGDADGQSSAFDPEPLSFRETGPSTGIFQIVVEIPQALDGDSLQRGEEIDLEYTDWGPSGSDYVGDQDEDIRLTVFTSNFGATIDLDQKVYSWTDKVYITVVAPDHNFDSDLIDEIGEANEDPLRVATKGHDLDDYRLVETGFDTGIFTGEVILVGFDHDGIGYEPSIRTGGQGPTNGYLETPSDGGISVSYEFSEDETVFTSSIIRWNIGDVQWLEASYPASGTGVLRVIDPDRNLNPEAVDNIDVNIASDTDASGITLTATETNEATGIFEGTVFFTTTGGSSGHRLRVSEGDTVTADYADGTLPLPYTTNDNVSITSTTIIGTIVPPLERAPATNLRIVDTFGSSIDAVSIDQQVQITADLSNGQDRDQDFAYLIQIQDSDGVTVSLSWIAGSLSPGQSFSPSASWTPTSVGTYDVTAFVWESIDNPTALSPPLTIDVSVN